MIFHHHVNMISNVALILVIIPTKISSQHDQTSCSALIDRGDITQWKDPMST